MFWPLIGGFIAFVLLAIVIGWWVDPDRGKPKPSRSRGRSRL
jgi:hypothetical protein